MAITGSVLLLLGVIGIVTSFINRTTTGWAGTRLKFVITSWGFLAIGISLIAIGLENVELFFRTYRF